MLAYAQMCVMTARSDLLTTGLPFSISPPPLQASYSKDGIFIGAAATCTRTDANGEPVQSELSALYVLSKSVICEPPYAPDPSHAPIPEVPAAVYFAHRAWYRSVAETELAMIEDEYEPFNSYIAPARAQNADDLDNKPLFAMKVRSHLQLQLKH